MQFFAFFLVLDRLFYNTFLKWNYTFHTNPDIIIFDSTSVLIPKLQTNENKASN